MFSIEPAVMARNDHALPHPAADPIVSVGGGVRAANAARREREVIGRDRPVF